MVNATHTEPCNRLRVLRNSRTPVLSQWVTADLAQISHNRYWRIEAGRIDATPEEKQRLADLFGVSVRRVFPGRQSSRPAA